MTADRKPALKLYTDFENGGKVVLASDLPPAILALTAPELRALAVFAEAIPELLAANLQPTRASGEPLTKFQFYPTTEPAHVLLVEIMESALAAAKEPETKETK